MVTVLSCPVCSHVLQKQQQEFVCDNNHNFDVASEGYVNLLLAHEKKTKDPGDSKEMLRARRAFLQKGFYEPLARRLSEVCLDYCKERATAVVGDIGCGEGYYTSHVQQSLRQSRPCEVVVFGLDISRSGIRLASKGNPTIQYIIASARKLPFLDESFDLILNIFAPPDWLEFSRILREGGKIIVVRPGPRHLYQFKEALSLTGLLHEEPTFDLGKTTLRMDHQERMTNNILLPTKQDILHLCQMTPFAWRSTAENQAKLALLEQLETEIDFSITILEKKYVRMGINSS